MDKKMYYSIMGDSLSTFEGWLPEGFPAYYDRARQYETNVYSARETWWHRVITHFGGEVLVNNSWSGSFVTIPAGCMACSCGCSDARTGALGVDDILPDHILVCISANDWGSGFPLTGADKGDVTVIENAYGLMLDKLKRNYPRAQIWCFTYPKTTCTREPDYVFPTSLNGIPVERYGQVILDAARQRGCHVVDLYHCEGLCDTVDRLHPNYEGMRWIAEHAIAIMEKI